MLYLIPTPIGNLEDITLRALRLLQEVDFILAEDTRKSGVLLKHYQISKPLQSYHLHNEHQVVERVVQKIAQGQKAALITDAGTPAISDPGFLLVRACVEAGIEVQCLAGATAFVPALVQSALPSDRFVFEGFLPPKKGRQTRLGQILQQSYTTVLYESPHRLLKTLQQLIDLGANNRQIAVCRELSKLHEETFRGNIEEALAHFQAKDSIKGEIVLVLGAEKKIRNSQQELEEDDFEA
ncbi:16S rRNA (cytidine(1402)-2'-O)-methyltransferase [Hugenholtzia roseola]|uniref:16S rRNA (cytidine(1402)-2'-O)-methyltransferase n=1 Tax=Hugenholtzia roseola TaxID=1002 RepID=UPI0006869CA6|nr:16S rRNA (cytidine(1402)-2'-O)-methyltransferase [Hugenholtzia roseola]